jgi:hypothetical protein
MGAAIRAGLLYVAMVFAAGFVLGIARVLLLAPAIGELKATLVELPIILAFSWLACRHAIGRFRVPAGNAHRLTMGAVAFAFLMLAELGVGSLSGGVPQGTGNAYAEGARRFLASFDEPARLLGLLGQICFALFPLLQSCPKPRQA